MTRTTQNPTRSTTSGPAPVTGRVALAALALTGVGVGTWALLAPASFHLDFPGFGRHWVAPDGPYNEHLVRDVGALYLALGVVAVAAVVRGDRWTAGVAAAGWLTFSVPHLAYHATHLEPFSTSDDVLQLVSLGLTVVLAVAVLLGGAVAAAPVRAARVPAGAR